MKKRHLKSVIIMMIVALSLIGVSYAFFTYYVEGEKTHEIIAGEVYLSFKDNTNSISLSNMYPETPEEARKRTDNVITFTIEGKSTITNKDVYYEILLNEGKEKSGMTRFNPDHLVFDLIEIDEENNRNYVVNAVKYSDINARKIWADTLNRNSSIERTYELRMWLDEKIVISDTEDYADYSTSEFENRYASIMVSVSGDLDSKFTPLVVQSSNNYVKNNNAYLFVSLNNEDTMTQLSSGISTGKLTTLDNTDTSNELIKTSGKSTFDLSIKGTNSDIVFSYVDSLGTEVTTTSETLNLTYDIASGKNVEIQLFVISKNDTNGVTDVEFILKKNGNTIQEFVKRMRIYGDNFCLNNGFTKLYDCIIASDSLATDIETAKLNVATKGEANINDTAPTYTYVEIETSNVSNVYSATGYQFYFADRYEFDPTSGNFKLYNSNESAIILDYLSDDYKNYYTCGATTKGNSKCSEIYRIDTTSSSGNTYTITSGDKITYKIATSLRSEVGLYSAEDDWGTSYFYRGAVTNNNVYFAGSYWKILRTNGDGSIRLIYNGDSTTSTNNNASINKATYTYSKKAPDNSLLATARLSDPTYVGYMYGKNYKITYGTETSFEDFASLTQYYFADGYEFDTTNEVFKLKKVNVDPKLATFSEMNGSYATYPYTCVKTSLDDVCEVLIKVNSLAKATQAKAQYYSYSSIDKASTRTNKNSSNAKTLLENWYDTNIATKTDAKGKNVTKYIVDGTFCNDRGIKDSTYNSGYLLSKNTLYAAYTRLTNSTSKTATLKCNGDVKDTFSYTPERGNGLLERPIGLITADEVSLAGGFNQIKNNDYYLKNGGYQWTMTPANYNSINLRARMWFISPTGALNPTGKVSDSYGLRPVINLSNNVLIESGNGTTTNPYSLKLS